MRFGLRASSVADVNKVGTSLITSRRVIFVPNTEIKEELAKTSINITCYDRNGEIVKRVTSSDEGNVEDPEDDNGGDGNGSSGSSGSNGSSSNSSNSGTSGTGDGNGSNSGNGSVTPSVSAPSFAGNTQFEESTEVTISGPSGSEIHYTVDGSTPTAESPVYSEPLTFTETTTLKAIAIKDGQSSEVTSRTYTKGTNGGGNGDGTDFD